jgi:hypothetical protein
MSGQIVVWLKTTALSKMVITYAWVWPLCETLHFIGLALLLGAAGFFDLRLMGLLRQVPIAAVMRLRIWAAVGVAINLATGILFFVGAPDQYISNPAWWAKVTFLLVAMINVALFETRQGKSLLALAPDADTPIGCKIAGAVSLGSWLAVLYFGRMLPFIGNAF